MPLSLAISINHTLSTSFPLSSLLPQASIPHQAQTTKEPSSHTPSTHPHISLYTLPHP
jgi:hypothetical protein